MIYLYIKTHNKTGLKYLGKTTAKDPHKYKGSGKMWTDHCSKHGFDYSTEVLLQTDNKDDIRAEGIRLSCLWNIVESKEWANLKIEEGDGGITSGSFKKGHVDKRTPETKANAAKKASRKLKGRKQPVGFGEAVGNRLRGTKMSDEAKEKMKTKWTSERKAEQAERMILQNQTRPEIVCPHCGFVGTNPGNMKRYHFTQCKSHLPAKPKKSTGKLKHDRRSKWIFVSPDNITHIVDNLRQFCRCQNLNNGSMCEVASGNRKTHKGWRLAE